MPSKRSAPMTPHTGTSSSSGGDGGGGGGGGGGGAAAAPMTPAKPGSRPASPYVPTRPVESSPLKVPRVEQAAKYVVVTGGVMSGLGKGITASSIGRLLKDSGFTVTAIKIDPYLNCDAGTMSPFEHGECFVLDDGGETDLDLGNYERFLDVSLSRDNSMTTGNVYKAVIDKEREGKYLGKTVQVIPHITGHIVETIKRVANTPTNAQGTKPDYCIIELGGTVGDIESMPFIEALRQLKNDMGSNMCLVHISLVPTPGDEQKTKPTQHSVKLLSTLGLFADFVGCRCDQALSDGTRKKIASFCNIRPHDVVSLHDVRDIWQVPLILNEQSFLTLLATKMGLALPNGKPDLTVWRSYVAARVDAAVECNIAIVAKYTGMNDTYLSVIRALEHAACTVGRRLKTTFINSGDLDNPEESEEAAERAASVYEVLESCDGILVPGGFGVRGVEGKLRAVKFAREKKKPFLGICLGMQIAVIEVARTLLGLDGANSSEFDAATPHPVIKFMPEGSTTHLGGTMRLGARETRFADNSCLAARLYGGASSIFERHRHRYEVNTAFLARFEAETPLVFCGKDTTGERMEVVELPESEHPYFVGVQYHPEFKSRPGKPSPVFRGLLAAAAGRAPVS